MTTSDSASGRRTNTPAILSTEDQLLRDVEQYLRPTDIEHVTRVLAYANELDQRQRGAPDGARSTRPAHTRHWDVEYGVAVAETLADAIHIDAISLAAVLLYQAVESGLATLDDVRARLGAAFGEEVAQTIRNIARFDMLQRPATAARRSAQGTDGEELSRDRLRSRERARRQDAETIRRMIVAMSEDPRVAVFKIADQLRLMRAIYVAAEYWRERASAGDVPSDGASDAERSTEQAPRWSADECRFLAEETREIYAPLAGRLGMGRVEGELDDLAFAVLEPEDFHWLSDAVAEYTQVRGGYIERVCDVLQKELRAIGLHADVTGRAKHLYSIFKKVQRTGSRDLTELYDILAFRIIVDTVEQCYLALGHVHALWRPKDGRIKDFIANPKPNGYQSLHTTVFCLDNRLAEIQIRTREMHQIAEYGVAMHWYYKDIGDQASGQSRPLQSWVQQVKEWQNELQGGEPGTGAQGGAPDTRGDQIFIFTPAGDVKELPAGATPLDFAYRIHTDVGNHVAGVRVQSSDATGRLVKKLVPLDYELKNGDVVEIIKRKDAHPTRDWLHVAKTKTAKDRIRKYLEAHERDIDMQIGRERLDRELKLIGVRRGYEELSEDDLKWLVEALEQRDTESLLVALGSEKLRTSVLTARLRERFKPAPPVEAEQTETAQPPALPARDTQVGANVAGVTGILTQLANCCDPLPGDEVIGFISRGRGVMIHRADCPTLAHLLAKQPERRVAVELPKATGGEHTFRAPIVIEALDRTRLLADVTGVITGMKINMLKVATVTKPAQHKATITATLEIQRPEQLNAVIAELKQVRSVVSVERKRVAQERGRR